VKPRHDVLHRQRQTNCSVERLARHDDERADDREEIPGWLQEGNRSGREANWEEGEVWGRARTPRPAIRRPAEGKAQALESTSRPGPQADQYGDLYGYDFRGADLRGADLHGRTAEHPKDIPKRGWRDIAVRVWQNLGRDNAALIAAGIGLNALLAVFPGLAVVVSVYGMFASPQDVMSDLRPFLGVLPGDAAQILITQLQNLTTPTNRTLGFGAVFSAIVALWNSKQGMSALLTATNIAYQEREKRGLLRQTAIALAFTVGAMLILAVMVAIGVAVPLVLQMFPLGRAAIVAVLWSRWLLLWVCAVLALSLAYHYAPDRQPPKWRWVTWGAAIAATVWILGSAAFAAYVQNFGSYGKIYGALGGAIVLLMWFYLMGFTIVLGAEINAEMEHQTAMDTTEGPPAPMGRRGAYVADTLGRTRS
jgi:membrane protein